MGKCRKHKGETGADGTSVNVYKDTAHGQIIFVGDDTEATIYKYNARK